MNKPPFEHRIKKPFKYVPSNATDVTRNPKWVAAIREAKKALEAANRPQRSAVIRPIKKERQAA